MKRTTVSKMKVRRTKKAVVLILIRRSQRKTLFSLLAWK